MMTQTGSQSKNYWSFCPNEVLLKIFEQLDLESLTNCSLVNTRWKDIVYDLIERNGLWKDIVQKNTDNKGVTIMMKTNLEWKELFNNILLWRNISSAKQDLIHTYQKESVRTIHVYRGDDFVETDKLIFKCTTVEGERNIELLGKSNDTKIDYSTENIKNTLNKIVLYEIEDNCCYTMDTMYAIYEHKWENDKWQNSFLARMYSNSVTSMHVHLGDIYVILRNGVIYHIDKTCKQYEKVFSLEIPANVCNLSESIRPIMFYGFSVVISVPETLKLQLKKQRDKNTVVISCPNLTCAMPHGNLLLLGYSTGKVELYISNKLITECSIPETQMDTKKWNDNLNDNIGIVALDVYEDNCAHHILIATQYNIYQVLLSHSVKC